MPEGRADSQALLDVMAEVRRLGALDPAAEKELMENLRHTRPELWPLVVEQFRAALAYRQKADERPTAGQEAASAPQGAPLPPGPRDRSGEAPASSGPPAGKRVAAMIEPPTTESAGPADKAKPAGAAAEAKPGESRVEQTSYSPKEAEAWQEHLDEAIRSLEPKLSSSPQSSEEIAQHARLRMLYLLRGQRDAALAPIPSVAPGTQDFWSNELYGLAALLDGASAAEPSRLAAEAQRPLDEAVARLGESCPLVLANLAFVTDVQSYGVFKPFAKYEFAPCQKVLLYAEVENFKSDETEKGFHTALKSSYQIFDVAGRRVAQHEFTTNEETCRNRRRDFFLIYEFSLPKQIYPGKHVLKLTVDDVASGKVGESSIEFTVVAAEK